MDAIETVTETEPQDEFSLFLPGTKLQYAWDSTSLEYLKRCPRLYYYRIIERLQNKGDNIHLRFGGELHTAFEDYDKSRARGIKHDDALHDTVRGTLERIYDWHPEPRKPTEKVKSKENLIRTIVWYLDEYKDDPAKTVILDNGEPAVELTFKFELDWGPDEGFRQALAEQQRGIEEIRGKGHPTAEIQYEVTPQNYVLCGHLDRVVEFNNGHYVMDYKTSSTTPGEYYFDQYDPHNQMSLYTLASKVILENPIKGVIINALQIAVGFTRPVRGFTYRNDERLDEWTYDLQYWLMQNEMYVRNNYWPQNDTACDKYGGCPFRGICNKAPSVRPNFIRADFEVGEQWNPLIPR